MNKEEAKSIFKSEVERYRTMPYDDLVQVVENDVYNAEHIGASGTRYLIELKTKRKKKQIFVSPFGCGMTSFYRFLGGVYPEHSRTGSE